MPSATIDSSALEQGLREALQVEGSLLQFNYKTLVLGSTASIIQVNGLKYKARNHYSKAVVKMFRNEPLDDQVSEPIHDLFNQPDKLYNAEERNLRNIETLLGRTFVPTLYGKSTNHRVLVMEPLGSKTRKDRLLAIAKSRAYTGEKSDVPTDILDIFYNAIDILGPFTGACHSRADEFERLHNYSDDAQALESRWAGSFEERLLRLHRRCKKGKPVDIAEDLKVIDEASKSFSPLENFYHGDFNLLQILGEKIIDFELFGKNVKGIDLASLLVVAGLKNSTGIIQSQQFVNLLDRYIISVHQTKEALQQKYQKNEGKRLTPFQNSSNVNKSLRKAINDSRSLGKLTASDLHRQALEICGSEQKYAHLVFSNYLQALNQCIRLGAAYDRMDNLKNHLKTSGEPTDYSFIINGLLTGMNSLLDDIDKNTERFKLVSPASEKKILVKRYRYLLHEKLGII